MIDWHDPDSRLFQKLPLLAMLRWSMAAAAIAAAHGGGVWLALNWKPAEVMPGEQPPAVMIELAPMAVAPEARPQDVAPGPLMTEMQPQTENELQKASDKPVVNKPDQPMPDRPDEKIPDLPKIDHPEAVLTPSQSPQPAPSQDRKLPEKKKVERKPVDQNKPKSPQTTAPPTSEAKRANVAAAPAAGSALARSASPASWKSAMMAHINRYKRFPAGAAETGTVTVAFTINRSGQVLSARLAKSSGDSALDSEAVALPRRASPFPAPPSDVSGEAITLAVPINFSR